MAVTQNGTLSGQSLNDYFAVLSTEHRQAVVSVLAARDRSVTLSSLARWVAAERQSVERETIAEQEIKRTKVKLHHSSLPMLDDAGVLEYCFEDQRVVPTEALKTVERFRETVSPK
ncbi:DUF7344 domain-containing protein [Halopelagius fulvigenes]|uniref:DUF7344 domain-containing protein n=1 Tax=Halopelagius fulvigenes TaxID=1198324 RepID=A0ABD5TTM0_9EURY